MSALRGQEQLSHSIRSPSDDRGGAGEVQRGKSRVPGATQEEEEPGREPGSLAPGPAPSTTTLTASCEGMSWAGLWSLTTGVQILLPMTISCVASGTALHFSAKFPHLWSERNNSTCLVGT